MLDFERSHSDTLNAPVSEKDCNQGVVYSYAARQFLQSIVPDDLSERVFTQQETEHLIEGIAVLRGPARKSVRSHDVRELLRHLLAEDSSYANIARNVLNSSRTNAYNAYKRIADACRENSGEEGLKVYDVLRIGSSPVTRPDRVGKQALVSLSALEPYAPVNSNDLSWMSDGLCRQTDPEAFFPEDKKASTIDAAKLVCVQCDIGARCLAYALTNDEEFGVWGAMTTAERRKASKTLQGNVSDLEAVTQQFEQEKARIMAMLA